MGRLKEIGWLKFWCVIDIAMLLTWLSPLLRFGRCYAHLHVFGNVLAKTLNPVCMILNSRLDLLLQFLAIDKLVPKRELV